jgi:carboxymethylenebutenolidase
MDRNAMGEFTTIMARDGHEFQAYLCPPPGKPQGAVVVIQEIFGVNSHIRGITEDFAKQGYTAIAPSLFDRIRRSIELGYSQEDMQEGAGYMQQLKLDDTLKDLNAAVAVVRHSGRVGTVGYCWGGAMSYVCAAELPIACGVVYYGRAHNYLDHKPRVPVIYHFGTQDKSIPLSEVEKVKAADPNGIFYFYEAGHGFNCDQRPSFNPEAAALARQRTLAFLARHLAGKKTAE